MLVRRIAGPLFAIYSKQQAQTKTNTHVHTNSEYLYKEELGIVLHPTTVGQIHILDIYYIYILIYGSAVGYLGGRNK